MPWYWQLPSSVYPVTGVVVLALIGWRLLRIHRPALARRTRGVPESADLSAQDASLTRQI